MHAAKYRSLKRISPLESDFTTKTRSHEEKLFKKPERSSRFTDAGDDRQSPPSLVE